MANEIETKTSDELGLLLGQQYQTLRQVEQNILMLTTELDARMKRHKEVENELSKDDNGIKQTT